jgi:nucleotide-binding universal stress UspA family protein
MAKRILVPLDGIPGSEAALPVVEDLARGAGATVRLLHVTPWLETIQTVDGRVVAYADQRVTGLRAEWEHYLARVAEQLGGIPVECAVRLGFLADRVLEEASTWPADLVVVMQPPHAGWAHLWRSTLTEQIQGKSDRPVLARLSASRAVEGSSGSSGLLRGGVG